MVDDTPLASEAKRLQRLRLVGQHLLKRLKLRHLELLAALHIYRKLNDAAVETGLSQPAASKMLSEIEKIVGVQLFTRLPRGIEPTVYGEVMIRRAQAALAELARAGEEIAALREGMAGSVAVGAVTGPAIDILFEAIQRMREARPNVQIFIDVEPSDRLIEGVLAGRLDFAISRIPKEVDPSLFVCEQLEPEELALLVREEHPLARLSQVEVSDLVDCEWVLQPRGSLLRRSIEAMMVRHNLPVPTRVIGTASTLLSLAVATKSDTIAPLAVPLADIFLPSSRLRRLPLNEKIEVEPFGVVRLKCKVLSPAAQELYRLLMTTAEENSPGRADLDT